MQRNLHDESSHSLLAGPISYAAAGIGLLFWFAATAWLRPLSLPDEGRYVGVSLEMLWSGNWLVPTLDSLPYFHKPPLFYWMSAAALGIFGIHEWVARIPSLLAATGTTLALYAFMRRWAAPGIAQKSLLILATTPFFFGAAQFANLDMLVAAMISCTILCAADAVLCAEQGLPRRLQLGAAYAFAALGVLAKGLIGAAIPALVIGAWLLALRQYGPLRRLFWPLGIVLFALIALPWFVLVQSRHPGFFEYFFVKQHWQRFTTDAFNNRHAFWFYVPILAAGTLPWSVGLLATVRLPHSFGSIRPEVRTLMWAWVLVPVVFFSIPTSKLPGYILPAVPPLAALSALAFTRLSKTRFGTLFSPWRITIGAAIACIAMATAVALRTTSGIGTIVANAGVPISSEDRVITLRTYPFSLGFYLRHSSPIFVVDDWQQSRVRTRDTWRKELWDAAQFEPTRAGLLVTDNDLTRLLCASHTAWVIGSPDSQKDVPILATLHLFYPGGPQRDAIWVKSPSWSCPS